MCVCVCVSLRFRKISFEPYDLRPRYLKPWFNLTQYACRSNFKVKVIGQGSQSKQENKIPAIAGMADNGMTRAEDKQRGKIKMDKCVICSLGQK